MTDHSKRTRSQLALPDDEFGEVHFGISPLRAARQERRKNLQPSLHTESSGPSWPLSVGVGEDDSDDELLLSPHKTRPLKRPPLSQQPGSSSEIDSERQYKRSKQDHNDGRSNIPASEIRRPSGPFDFSTINPQLVHSTMSSGQMGMSSKQRAYTVPLVSSTIGYRDLGRLMPSPGKVSIVPPVHEVLRFSSLPCSLEPLVNTMDVDNTAKLSVESERVRDLSKALTPPPHKGLDSSSCQTPVAGEKSSPSISPLPSVTLGQEIIPSNPSDASPSVLPQSPDLPTMAPHGSLEGPENDVTPKPIHPPPVPPLDVNPIPFALGDPPFLPDDPPSPLSALSSLSELESSPPPHDPEIDTPPTALPSSIPQAIQPPPSPSHGTKNTDSLLLQAARRATSTSRGRGGRGFMRRPSGSTRLTRSTSTKKQKGAELVDRDIDMKPQDIPSSVTSSVPVKRSADPSESTPHISKKPSSMAVSHRKSFSFAMPTSSSLNKTIEKAPASSPVRPSSLPRRQLPKLPSPTKPALSQGPGEPLHLSKHTGLSNLSLALEKLKIPPPSRPATSLGFNSDARGASNTLNPKNAPKAKDDSNIRLGNGLPPSSRANATPLRRVVTEGSIASLESNARASGSKPAPLIATPAHPTDSGPPAKKINLHSGVIVGKNSLSKPRGFVYGGVGNRRPFDKVSKKSSLPVVEGSPVKGTGNAQPIDLDEVAWPSTSAILGEALPPCKDNGQAEASTAATAIEPMKLQEAFVENDVILGADRLSGEDGQAETADVFKDASRRASLASQFLQQTLAVLPSTPPPTRASGSKSKDTERLQSSSQSTRSGLRSGSGSDVIDSRDGPRALSKGHAVDSRVSRIGLTSVALSSTTKASSLKVLKSCTIFVDVRTDDGDDAGGLFVDMLKGLGAKIIGRAGQSCTHIVYKNGLMSTLTKYRLMREPKPFVVGISWVVECAEQCRRVGEENFLVDLEGLNVAGTNKRRRSMLPKHISSSIQAHTMAPPSLLGPTLTGTLACDQSMDGSSVGADRSLHSSDGVAEDEDDLPPLERARQRRNIFFRS